MKRKINLLTPYMFLLPAVILLGFALIYPMGYLSVAGFYDWRMGTTFESSQFVGWDNYLWILTDSDFRKSLQVTVVFAFSVVAFEMLIGLGIALLLDRKIWGMGILRTMFILPMMIAPIVVGLMWRYMYHPQFGILNILLNKIGVPSVPWLSDPDWALASVVIADVWQWFPFIFILSLAALQGVPRSLLESARIDGANAWQQAFFIKVPLIMPVLIIAALLRLIDAFKVLEVIFIMTNGGPGLSTQILSLRIYKTAFVSSKLGEAAALSNILLMIVFFIALCMIIFTKIRKHRSKSI